MFTDDINMVQSDLFNNIQSELGISQDIVLQSIQEASNFFHIEDPAAIGLDMATGVYNYDPYTLSDDVVVYNPIQLTEMGIYGKDGLDLIMTHEGTHRVLQGMDTGFNSHQEELCCDYMAGVRAGLNDMDVSQLKDSLIDTVDSITHPNGELRVEAIDAGIEFAKDYYYEHGEAPTFNECLDNFCENVVSDSTYTEQITLREEGELTFKGYSQSEINNRISETKSDMAHAESSIRHHSSLASSKASMGEPHGYEDYQIKKAQREYNEAKTEYQKWSRMKAEEK